MVCMRCRCPPGKHGKVQLKGPGKVEYTGRWWGGGRQAGSSTEPGLSWEAQAGTGRQWGNARHGNQGQAQKAGRGREWQAGPAKPGTQAVLICKVVPQKPKLQWGRGMGWNGVVWEGRMEGGML